MAHIGINVTIIRTTNSNLNLNVISTLSIWHINSSTWTRSCVCCPQYLACLKTSRSQTDKLSFDVGLQEDSTGKTTPLAQFAFIHLFFFRFLSCWLRLSLSISVFVLLSVSLSVLPSSSFSRYLSPRTLLFMNVCVFFFSISVNIPHGEL